MRPILNLAGGLRPPRPSVQSASGLPDEWHTLGYDLLGQYPLLRLDCLDIICLPKTWFAWPVHIATAGLLGYEPNSRVFMPRVVLGEHYIYRNIHITYMQGITERTYTWTYISLSALLHLGRRRGCACTYSWNTRNAMEWYGNLWYVGPYRDPFRGPIRIIGFSGFSGQIQ